MGINEILNQTGHRGGKLPVAPWRYYQEWNKAVFLHWQVDYDQLRRFVPSGLEIDLYDNKPWVSLVAFSMERIRPRYLPYFSPVSNFHEINIRTYVKSGGKEGVYFLSIEAGNRFSCEIARRLSALPYRYSKIHRAINLYESFNPVYKDKLSVRFSVGKVQGAKNKLDHWLTERYALFQDSDKGMNEFDIHHLEWQIRDINIQGLRLQYDKFSRLLKGNPDLVHYSDGVQVLAWDKSLRLSEKV